MGYIYKITNKLNQKIYIGQTTKQRPTDRFSQHRYLAKHPEQEKAGVTSYLHRAMAKYGVDNFSFEVIEQVSNEKLNEREQYWIAFYDCTIPNGYNMTKGGEGTPGFSRPQSEEERKKKGNSVHQYYVEHPEAREQVSKRWKQYYEEHPEAKEKISKRNRQYYKEHPGIMAGENNPMYGKHHTKEAYDKMIAFSAALKNPIAQLDKDTLKVIQVFDGVKDAEKALGVSHGWLSKAARQGKIAYGYRWEFCEKCND